MRPLRLLLRLAAPCGLLAALPVHAQAPTNADVLGRLAASCGTGVPAPAAFYLAAPGASPYLRSALGGAFGGDAARVLSDSAARARIAVQVERAGIAYAPAGRGRLRRTATLRLRTRVVDEAGTVRYDDACTRDASDVIPATRRRALEDALWPETVGIGPAPSRLRRTLEVGLVAGAVVTSTLLLFSLRSR